MSNSVAALSAYAFSAGTRCVFSLPATVAPSCASSISLRWSPTHHPSSIVIQRIDTVYVLLTIGPTDLLETDCLIMLKYVPMHIIIADIFEANENALEEDLGDAGGSEVDSTAG